MGKYITVAITAVTKKAMEAFNIAVAMEAASLSAELISTYGRECDGTVDHDAAAEVYSDAAVALAQAARAYAALANEERQLSRSAAAHAAAERRSRGLRGA